MGSAPEWTHGAAQPKLGKKSAIFEEKKVNYALIHINEARKADMNARSIDYSALYKIRDFSHKLAELITLHREVKKEDMPKGDKDFAKFISNGIDVRPSWVANMRSGKAMSYDRVHATFTATNKLIEELGGTQMPLESIALDEKATEKSRGRKS